MKANGHRTPIQHFLLVFDQSKGELIEQIQFGSDGERAVAAYDEKEQEYYGRERIEVVLVGSDSIETIKVTHANYFGGIVGSKYLADIA